MNPKYLSKLLNIGSPHFFIVDFRCRIHIKYVHLYKKMIFIIFNIVALTFGNVSIAFSQLNASEIRSGKDYALLFAVKDYDNWSDLKNPIKDAEAIAKVLREQYDYDSIRIVPNPSLQVIWETLTQYLSASFDPNDQLFVFFSGHGTFNDLTREGFFIPRDALSNDPFQSSYLPLTRLERIMAGIACNHILMTIDACYSGTFNEKIALSKNDEISKPTWRLPGIRNDNIEAKQNWIKSKLEKRSRLCITSGGKERTSDGIDHSPLTESFLKSLYGPDDDGILTIDELVASIKNTQPAPKSFTFGDHEYEGSFLFIRNREWSNFNMQAYELRQLDLQAWKSARSANTIKGFQVYLDSFPQGAFRNDARIAIASAEEDLDWEIAKERNIPEVYQAYLIKYPFGRYKALAYELVNSTFPVSRDTISSSAPPHMVLVKGGTFSMGDAIEDKEGKDETLHSVTLSDFLIGKNELTFDEYDAFCAATGREKPKDSGWGRGRRPVVRVSWEDAVAYCNWRSKQEGLKEVYTLNISSGKLTVNWGANGYRLPTEAEWEYAAREEGKKVRFGNGEDIAAPTKINFDASVRQRYSVEGASKKKTLSVGSFSPNILGINDMSGNVWEWCWDWYGKYPDSEQINPKGPDVGSGRVVRGGSWGDSSQYCRAANRHSFTPGYRFWTLGFRLARSL